MKEEQKANRSLKKVLGPLHVWAIAVGLVISGEYFGWNYGWNTAGTTGFVVTTLIVTVLYICFTLSLTELAAAIPDAGGPFAYSFKAFGSTAAFIAGYSTFVEFVFAPPAIALAIGSYVNFLFPALAVTHIAAFIYVVFTLLNLLGVKEAAFFTVAVTVLALAELAVFISITLPEFQPALFAANTPAIKPSAVFAALPFAIWFYLGIEGVAMITEEVKEPARNVPKGTLAAIGTLVFISLAVMFCTGGVGDWRLLANSDHPLPGAISMVLGKQHLLTKIFAGLGLFGLIASFHSLMIGYSRQIFALAREGVLPRSLSAISKKKNVPFAGLLAGSVIGVITVYTGVTSYVITVSALGAIVMYILTMLSLIKLRTKHLTTDNNGYKTPLYPWMPVTAIILSLVCLISIIWYNLMLSCFFFLILLLSLGFRYLSGKFDFKK